MDDYMKRYIKEIRSSFPIFQKNEKRFFEDFKVTLTEFIEKTEGCGYEDLISNLGEPKEVVIDYFNNMDTTQYLSLLKRSYYIKAATFSALILMIVFFLFQTYSLYELHKIAAENVMFEEEITIGTE